jgi:ABC-type bacteriocin/lantibiotic exporter with double-glycine peptidase domain
MDYSDNEWTVADPAIGIVKWSDEEFRTRFTGDALFIEHN